MNPICKALKELLYNFDNQLLEVKEQLSQSIKPRWYHNISYEVQHLLDVELSSWKEEEREILLVYTYYLRYDRQDRLLNYLYFIIHLLWYSQTNGD